MNNLETKIGIICPLVDEYNACKEILDLNNESKISWRTISKRKENNIEVYAVNENKWGQVLNYQFLLKKVKQTVDSFL